MKTLVWKNKQDIYVFFLIPVESQAKASVFIAGVVQHRSRCRPASSGARRCRSSCHYLLYYRRPAAQALRHRAMADFQLLSFLLKRVRNITTRLLYGVGSVKIIKYQFINFIIESFDVLCLKESQAYQDITIIKKQSNLTTFFFNNNIKRYKCIFLCNTVPVQSLEKNNDSYFMQSSSKHANKNVAGVWASLTQSLIKTGVMDAGNITFYTIKIIKH